jgi:acyl-CoA thioester hydrolase
MWQHQLEIRVRYHETDGQGRVHHAQYLNFFERGRVEMMRDNGHSYRELEESGLLLVVTKFEIEYILPAAFDDLLICITRVERARGARIDHSYELWRDRDLLVKARSEIACIDRNGVVKRLPPYLQEDRGRRTPKSI